jgi:hypothetical protein
VKLQPKDAIANRMLQSLAPAEAPAIAAAPPTPAGTTSTAEPQTDLVGAWLAKSGDTAIELTIGDDSRFTWKASQAGKPPIELQGELTSTSDMLVLDSQQQGAMVGRVASGGPDQWQFFLAGAPPSDPGLRFERVRR